MTTFSTRCVLLAALPREELVARLVDEYQVVAGLTTRVERRAVQDSSMSLRPRPAQPSRMRYVHLARTGYLDNV
jgi:hypothetical protein